MDTMNSIEKHFTLKECAKQLGISTECARQIFMREPGVIVFRHEKAGRKTKSTYRVPASVVERVLRRSANPANGGR